MSVDTPHTLYLGHGRLKEEVGDGSHGGVGGREGNGDDGGADRTALKAELHCQSVLLIGSHLWDACE